jgi:DNA/RNA endonuclease YhcR with UshA esterase domain
MRKVMLMAALVAAMSFVMSARAQDEKKPEEKAPPTETIDVKDTAKIKENEGQTISVRGKVIEVFNPRSGNVKLFNFEGIGRRDFNVMIKKENFEAVNAAFNGNIDDAVKDKTIVVTGRVAMYRDNPQIEVATPDQIKIEEGGEDKKEEEKKPEEKPKE